MALQEMVPGSSNALRAGRGRGRHDRPPTLDAGGSPRRHRDPHARHRRRQHGVLGDCERSRRRPGRPAVGGSTPTPSPWPPWCFRPACWPIGSGAAGSSNSAVNARPAASQFSGRDVALHPLDPPSRDRVRRREFDGGSVRFVLRLDAPELDAGGVPAWAVRCAVESLELHAGAQMGFRTVWADEHINGDSVARVGVREARARA